MTLLVVVGFVGLIFGFVGAAIGNSKGLAGVGFLLGFLFGPIGLVIIAVIQPSRERSDRVGPGEGYARCPHCREYVRADATVCRYCQRDMTVVESPVDEMALDRDWERFDRR